MNEYTCGNCGGLVTQQPVKCTDGSLHQAYVCSGCGCTWFPWQIKRAIEWQKQEDDWKKRKDVRHAKSPA